MYSIKPDNVFIHFAAFKKNCAEIFNAGERRDGMYTIKPDNLPGFDVFCDLTTAGGGWTVFQKRLDGSVDFYLNWIDYKHGFGDLNGEFWLGLDKIHRLTSDNNNVLRVDLEDFEGSHTYAEYKMFGVKSENDKYKLILGSYSGKLSFRLTSVHRYAILDSAYRMLFSPKVFASGSCADNLTNLSNSDECLGKHIY